MPKKIRLITLTLALCVGIVFSLKNIILYSKTINNPQIFFTPFSGGDNDTYGAQIREVFEGKLFSGDAYSYETRNKLPINSWLPILSLGLIAKVLNSVELVFIFSDFFFPTILFILIVNFIYQLNQRYWVSVVTGLSTLFLFQLISKIPPVTKELAYKFWQAITLKEPIGLYFGRLPPPQFTFTVFFLFIISLYYTLTNKNKNKIIFLLPGILSGLLAYIYFYHWTVSLVMIAVCLGFNLLVKNKIVAKRLITILLIALIISSGYFYQIFSVNLIDKQFQMGRIDGRFIEPLTTLRYGLLTIIIFWLIRKPALKQLLASIFIAAVILVNLQVVVGYTISPGHWPNSTFEPLVVVSAGILLVEIFKKLNWQKALNYFWILIFPIFLYAILNQIGVIKSWESLYYLSSGEKRLYDWLNKNSPPDSVVLSPNKMISRRLPAITHQYPYLPYGCLSQLSTEQIWERFNLASSIIQLKPEYIRWLLKSQLVSYLFVDFYNYNWSSDLTGLDFPAKEKEIIGQTNPFFTFGYLYIPDNIKQASLDKISQYADLPVSTRICRYRLNYLVLKDSEKVVLTHLLDSNIFQLVFQEEDISLYQINSNLCP